MKVKSSGLCRNLGKEFIFFIQWDSGERAMVESKFINFLEA